jgi:Na+-translocating ferredoxin:NAD+ oxidoreductase subunit G
MAKESTFSGMLFTLLIVTFLASASLGYVYELTKEPIEIAMNAKKNMAIKRVTPEFNNDPVADRFSVPADGDSVYFYPAKDSSRVAGYAVETFSNIAFGGRISLLVGFLHDGTIKEIAVLEHKETPGLGDKMMKSKSDFSVQFEGKNPAEFSLKVKKDGGDVDAITAATISSRAFCDAVQRAYNALEIGGTE